MSGGRACGEAIVAHPGIARIGLIGSASTGRAVMKGAAERLKRVSLELGGKNALVAYPDSDPAKVADSIIKGMNFAWCGQSCGSTSRAFVHETLYEEVLGLIETRAEAIKPGLPTNLETDMGCLITLAHLEKVKSYIESGLSDGARLITGGRAPDDPQLAGGFYILPTIFADVRPDMKIACEEIFGPILSVIKWADRDTMLAQVNDTDYGLTAAVWTGSLAEALHFAAEVETGYVWVNNSAQHFPNAPFGGVKQSGLGREEGLEEILDCTEIKNVNVTYDP